MNKNTFDEILEMMLDAYEQNPNISQEQLLEMALEGETEQVKKQAIDDATNAAKLLDDFREKELSLQQTKKEGHSREYWLEQQFENIEASEEEKKLLLDAVNQSIEDNINNTILEDE